MKKLTALILCIFLALPLLASCSKPPEYAEIEARFRELVEASGEINMIFFGDGLETYERVSDPAASTKHVVKEETAEDGTTKKAYYYYYEIPDKAYGTVYAYVKGIVSKENPYKYLEVLSEPDAARTPHYEDAQKSVYAYIIDGYTEPEHELYYDESDPEDYDYVRIDEKYVSVSEIKTLAETVYSSEYLNSIYDSMFVGTLAADSSVSGLSARYMEYADDEGTLWLMKSNKFGQIIDGEYKPYVTEIRQYDFSTAKMVKPSNGRFVTIEIESYLPSNPNNRLTVSLSMILENGQWMLNSPTY